MKVLGISGSGRLKGYSSEIIKDMLSEITVDSEFISLFGKRINGCIGCLGCAEDNICVQKDDFQDVLDKVLEADALIFAGPNYYAALNVISSAFWERTFCLRHRERYALAGKLAIAVGLDRSENGPALQHIKRMMNSNKMAIISTFTNPGHYQCYDCGYGHDCVVGNVYPRSGLCSKEEAEASRPMEYSTDTCAKQKAIDIGRVLNSILTTRDS